MRAKSYVNNLYYPSEKDFIPKKKSKGVSSRHLKKRIDFEDYKSALNGTDIILGDKNSIRPEHRDKMYSFKSINMTTYSIESKKICLSGKDDKRIILKNRIDTLAIGHYKTRSNFSIVFAER